MTSASGEADQAFHGILQFSSAMTVAPSLGDLLVASGDESHRWNKRGIEDSFGVLTKEHIDRTRKNLELILPKGTSDIRPKFSLHPAYVPDASPALYASDVSVNKPPTHTWLGSVSRHAPIELPDEFHDTKSTVPKLLQWGVGKPIKPEYAPYLRVQWARDRETWDLQDDLPSDCNDYLVAGFGRQKSYDRLVELRAFMARLYAQRRMRIFASDLSHRMYNVWLPPGVLRSEDNSELAFAVLPFVTRVRRPYRLTFGRTVTLSIVLAPILIGQDGAQTPRQMATSEIHRVFDSLDGDSCHIPSHASDRFELVDSPLVEYCEELRQESRLPVTSTLGARALNQDNKATFRQWTELLFAASVESIFPKTGVKETGSESVLADEILKSIRLNALWSILVICSELKPYDANRDIVADGAWWPSTDGEEDVGASVEGGLPACLRLLLDALVGDERLPASPNDRLDDIRCGSPSALMWGIIQRQCVVTAYSAQQESFPDKSALNLFGWTNQLLNGAASTRALMGAMASEAEQSRDGDVSKLASRSYGLTLEIEEMFDLKIAWPEYELLYHRLKDRLGISDIFRRMKERQEQLSHHAEVIARTKEEQRIGSLQVLAAVFAIGIIGIGVEQVYEIGNNMLPLGWASLGTALAVAAVAIVVLILRRER